MPRISKIEAFQVDLPLHEGTYKWSGGKSVDVFDTTVVAVDTDAGVTGYGEVCPLGPAYLPAYAAWRARRHRELGPQSDRGEDPRELAKLNRPHGRRPARAPLRQVRHRHGLLGHPRQGRPACPSVTLLGGRYGDDFALYRAISQEAPDAMAEKVAGYRAEGYHRLSAQSRRRSATPTSTASAPSPRMLAARRRLIADANTGWTACTRRCASSDAVRDIDVYIEQPCRSYEECLAVRRHTDHPFVLDEVIDSHRHARCAGTPTARWTSSTSRSRKFGGLTKARQVRDSVRRSASR